MRCTFGELGAAGAPFSGALIGIADTQNRRLVERPPDDLHAERQAGVTVPVAQHQGRAAGNVERRRHVGLLPRFAHLVGVEAHRGRSGADRHQGIVLGIDRAHFGKDAPLFTLGLDIIDGAEQTRRKGTRQEIGAEIAGPRAQFFLMGGVELGFGDDDLDVVIILGRADLRLLDDGAKTGEHFEGRLHGRRGLRVGVVGPEMAQHAKAQSPDIAGQRGAVIGHGMIGTRRVTGVVAGNGLQQDGAVLDRPRHGAAGVEGERVRYHPMAADQAISRLQPGDAGKRRRDAHRTTGIRTQRTHNQARRHRRRRTARRTTGEMLRVPRITGRRPRKVEGRTAVGELVGRELPHQHTAGGVHHGGRCGIPFGNVVDENLGLGRGQDSGGVIDVL